MSLSLRLTTGHTLTTQRGVMQSHILWNHPPQLRRMFASKPPGSNPLHLLRKECMARYLCDEEGSRLPGVHWVFSLSVTPTDLTKVRSQ